MSREDQAINNRKRCILYLIEKYLLDNGFNSSVIALRNEATILHDDYEICDNIDLNTIYLEYCSYFNLKFNKQPKILKYIPERNLKTSKNNLTTRKSSMKKSEILNNETNFNNKSDNRNYNNQLTEFYVQGISGQQQHQIQNITEINFDIQEQLLFNGEHNFNTEWKELAKIICRDLIKNDPNLKWKNIFGNNNAIELLKEAIILPLEHPEYFTGVLNPWKAILLYGPPGTGKTLLAKTLCSEIFKKVAFFHIRSSTIISKWRGESEKIIRVLFEIACHYAPSIIFFDEIDGITSKRDGSTEHEASKRFKNELLSLMDDLERNGNNKRIFILGNTNIPWEIDPAFLRRFEKKILVTLPNVDERKKMIKYLLPNSKKLSEKVLNNLSIKCENFTGDEIRIACKEAAMKQIRLSCCKGFKGCTPDSQVNESDLIEIFGQIQPVGHKLMNKYMEWGKEYGNKL